MGLVENEEENQFVCKSSVHLVSYVGDVRKWFELLNQLDILAEKKKKTAPKKRVTIHSGGICNENPLLHV